MTLISTENYFFYYVQRVRSLLISGQLYPRTSGWVSQLPAHNERILVVPPGVTHATPPPSHTHLHPPLSRIQTSSKTGSAVGACGSCSRTHDLFNNVSCG